MNILLDMNLSPEWVPLLENAGHKAVHWSSMGAPSAPDTEIMEWAKTNDHVVLTHDLDYGALLYATNATAPSVVQIRSEDIRPASVGELVLMGLRSTENELLSGSLVTINPRKMRATSLPLKKKDEL